METVEDFLLNFSVHIYVAPLLLDAINFENCYYTLLPGTPLIKNPQFPDILNALNVQPHNIILFTI